MDAMNSFKTGNAIAPKINPSEVRKFPLTYLLDDAALVIVFLVRKILQNLIVSPNHSSIKS